MKKYEIKFRNGDVTCIDQSSLRNVFDFLIHSEWVTDAIISIIEITEITE